MPQPAEPEAEGPAPDADAHMDDRAPILGSWRNIYLLVLGSQALLVILFYLVTKAYE